MFCLYMIFKLMNRVKFYIRGSNRSYIFTEERQRLESLSEMCSLQEALLVIRVLAWRRVLSRSKEAIQCFINTRQVLYYFIRVFKVSFCCLSISNASQQSCVASQSIKLVAHFIGNSLRKIRSIEVKHLFH